MFYVKNLPMWERSLRIGAGTAIAAYALLSMGGVMGWLGGRHRVGADRDIRVLPSLCIGRMAVGKKLSKSGNR